MRLIDANALLDDLKSSVIALQKLICEAQDEEIKIRRQQECAAFVECALRVKLAPTIEAETVRNGRWEKHKDFLCYCTICGAVLSLPHHKFCGNCGSRMDGGAEK